MGKFGLMFAEKGEKCALCNEALWAGELAVVELRTVEKTHSLYSKTCAEREQHEEGWEGVTELLQIFEEREILHSIVEKLSAYISK